LGYTPWTALSFTPPFISSNCAFHSLPLLHTPSYIYPPIDTFRTAHTHSPHTLPGLPTHWDTHFALLVRTFLRLHLPLCGSPFLWFCHIIPRVSHRVFTFRHSSSHRPLTVLFADCLFRGSLPFTDNTGCYCGHTPFRDLRGRSHSQRCFTVATDLLNYICLRACLIFLVAAVPLGHFTRCRFHTFSYAVSLPGLHTAFTSFFGDTYATPGLPLHPSAAGSLFHAVRGHTYAASTCVPHLMLAPAP